MSHKKDEDKEFDVIAQTQFFKLTLSVLPKFYTSLEPSRMTVLFFVVSALDILGKLKDCLEKERDLTKRLLDWIYAMQVLPDPKTGSILRCGFRGGPYVGVPFDPQYKNVFSYSEYPQDHSNIAMTYTALCNLKILDEDLSRVNKKAIISALKHLQLKDGSFAPTCYGGENDMRFVFCACAISHLLDDWSGFDLDLATQYIVDSQSYDGAIGLRAGSEGHGGSTYCAVAALVLMGRLDRLKDKAGLIRWCVRSQGDGFCGRPNKEPDTCYSYWIGATMQLLGVYSFTNGSGNREHTMHCNGNGHIQGGFSKIPGSFPDVLHSYFGLAGLSLIGLDALSPIDASIAVTKRAMAPSLEVYHV